MSPKLPARLLATQSDKRLVEMVGEGNERAFDALVQRYRRQLLRYCARMGLSEARAEDVLQHAFLQAWLALERGAEVRELKPWLYRVVHNAAVNALRSSARDHGPLAEVEGLDSAPAVESELEHRIAVRAALSDVAALPQMQREALLMSAVDGRSHQEVANALGVTDGAVRGLLYRARATLRGAAAALTPQPLLSWGSGGASRVSQAASRLTELAGAGGGSDMGATLLKGAAVAVTGALAAGAVLGPLHHHGASHARRLASTALVPSDKQQSPSASELRSPGPTHAGVGNAHVRLVHSSPSKTRPGISVSFAPGPTGSAHGKGTAGMRPVTVITPVSSLQSGASGSGRSPGGASTGASSSGSTTQVAGGSSGESSHGGSSSPGGSPENGGSTSEGGGSHSGDGGEHGDGGSKEDEAEASREKAEQEAEETREHSEQEAERAHEQAEREHEKEAEEAHQGSGKDS
jgi:RNA polymerase sigma factor (sigma-70 family)